METYLPEAELLLGGAYTYNSEWPADPSSPPTLSTEFLPIEPLYPEISQPFSFECEPTSPSELLARSTESPEFYSGQNSIEMSPSADEMQMPNVEREDLKFSTTGIDTNYNAKEDDQQQEYKDSLSALNQDPQQPTVFSAEVVDDLCVEDILEIINEDSDKIMDSYTETWCNLLDLYDENNNEVEKSTQEIVDELTHLPTEEEEEAAAEHSAGFMADSEQFMNFNMDREDVPLEFVSMHVAREQPTTTTRRKLKLNITNPVGGQKLIHGLPISHSLSSNLNTPEILQDVIQLQQNYPPSEHHNDYAYIAMENIKSEPSEPEQSFDNEEAQELLESVDHIIKRELNFTIAYDTASPTVIVPLPSPSNSTSTSWAVQPPSYANSPAGCSSSRSSKSSESPGSASKRGRGRPRKQIRTEFDHRHYEGLSPTEKKYKMLRDKNNESSRKSRMNRTQKTASASEELKKLTKTKAKLEAILKRANELQEKTLAHLKVKC